MGVSRFLRLRVQLSIVDPPNAVPIDQVRQMIKHDDDTESKWEGFLKEIKCDNSAFTKFFYNNLLINEGTFADFFTLHPCEEVPYYLYCYVQYQRCCQSKWQYW